jgi:prepilin-type processing-associated H-X9-DG protein
LADHISGSETWHGGDISYLGNYCILHYTPRSVSQVDNSAERIVFGEQDRTITGFSYGAPPLAFHVINGIGGCLNMGEAVADNSTYVRVDEARHLEGANYAFLDGHVKWLKQEKAAPYWTWP